MKQWTVGRGTAISIIILLLVIAVVQVLPQVDLPDTAFHEDTAPIVRKFRVISATTVVPTASAPQVVDFVAIPFTGLLELQQPPSSPRVSVVPALFCCLLC